MDYKGARASFPITYLTFNQEVLKQKHCSIFSFIVWKGESSQMVQDLCQLLRVWMSWRGVAVSDSKTALKHAAFKASQVFALDQRQVLLQSSELWE